ncbi:adenosine deaminase [Pelagicoccus albus]|uniref:Adenosine deaminase n=2 Tax=Pelagicoccus albus TaxID=415222 RepID=A0A7X1B6L5_9BACT|nr:adenosine deaminase [Pelagicoccus albus]
MPFQATPELAAFVRDLPKTETHLHIEGACPFQLLKQLDPIKHSQPPPFWADDFRYRSFQQFMDLYVQYCSEFYTDAKRFHEAAKIILKNCVDQGCRYVETSFHLPTLLYLSDDGPTIIDAIRSAAPAELELRIFAGMCHNDYKDAGKDLIDSCLTWEGLDGIDLHGPEDLPLEPWTADIWEKARLAGKFTKAHAGEFMGSDFVDRVIDDLKVTRIEHGVRSIENPATVERLVRENIALDVCPISNLKLAVEGIPSMNRHPIRELFDAGVLLTVNSDDPFFFGNSLSEDYYALVQELGFSLPELAKLAANGFQVALLSEESRASYMSELQDYCRLHGIEL